MSAPDVCGLAHLQHCTDIVGISQDPQPAYTADSLPQKYRGGAFVGEHGSWDRYSFSVYEEFGISVSDNTVYRALKDLGFSHVSARPKAYKQNADAMEAAGLLISEMVQPAKVLAFLDIFGAWDQALPLS